MLTDLSPATVDDLRRSGLSEETIRWMQIREATTTDRELLPYAEHTGYIIPYIGEDGAPIMDRPLGSEDVASVQPFYRIRYHQPPKDGYRYAQPRDSNIHVYIPFPVWRIALDPSVPLVIVEGEKKAAKAVQEGIFTIALGGVNNVRQKKYRIASRLVDTSARGFATLSLNGHETLKLLEERVAPELLEFDWRERTVYIVFDRDAKAKTREEVQKAAFDLAYWLHGRGALVHQVLLPTEDGKKIALDDYLLVHSAKDFWELTKSTHFPTHPHLRTWLQSQLDRTDLRRNDWEIFSRAIVAELDAGGKRYRDEYDPRRFYYFDEKQHHLFSLDWTESANGFRVGDFAELITRRFNIGVSDSELLGRVAKAYVEECRRTKVRKVSYIAEAPKVPTDTLYLQLSDNCAAKVNKDDITLVDNGTDGVLFEPKKVRPVELDPTSFNGVPRRLWRGVVEQLNLAENPVLSDEELRSLMEVLCYLSPLFRDWRGLELPVEMAVGEPGSGKSRFYYVRTGVLTGEIAVGVTPRDIQELRTFLLSARGIYVFDNVRPGSLRSYREQFEEELARVVTLKHIQYRPLYTDTDIYAPVDCTLAMTTTSMPVHALDLMERSLTFGFKRITPEKSVDDWEWKIIYEQPGRPALLTDMLLAAREFFRLVDRGFEANHRKSVRLEGFERALLLMAEALDPSGYLLDVMTNVTRKLPDLVEDMQANADAALGVLKTFVDNRRTKSQRGECKPQFVLREVVDFVSMAASGQQSYPFRTAQELGAYIKEHATIVAHIAGIRLDADGSYTVW